MGLAIESAEGRERAATCLGFVGLGYGFRLCGAGYGFSSAIESAEGRECAAT